MLKSLLIMILLSQTVHADLLKFLKDDKEAIQARSTLIANAKREILVEYYAVTDDDVSTSAIALLCEASRNGRKVKILLDALSSQVKKSTMYATTQHCKDQNGKTNIEFKLFNPLKLENIGSIMYRTHEKMIIVDGKKIITGGRNVDNKYFGLNKKRNFHDLDVLIEGPMVKIARDYYYNLWYREDIVETPNYRFYDGSTIIDNCKNDQFYYSCKDALEYARKRYRHAQIEIENTKKRLDALHQAYLDGNGFTLVKSSIDPLVDAFDINSTDSKFLSSSAFKDIANDEQKLGNQLYDIFSKARKKILILSPYLIPNKAVKEMFQDLIKRNVKITVITNSLKSTDNLFAQSGYKLSKNEMINMGIEVYEYNVIDTTHAKAAVIDDETALIGTFNLDPRSSNINREIGVKIDNPVIAAELTTIINDFKSRSLLVGKDKKEHNLRLQEENVSLIKKVGLIFLRPILPLIEDQL